MVRAALSICGPQTDHAGRHQEVLRSAFVLPYHSIGALYGNNIESPYQLA